MPDDLIDCPPLAVEAATKVCGPVQLEPVSDRRGSAVWKATGPRGSVAVKAGTGVGADITGREASILEQLHGYFVVSGRDRDAAWLVTPWWDGPSTWEVFETVRTGMENPAALLAAARLCRAVAAVHDAGWVHCDLQPDHAVHTEHGVRLMDWSWAWSDTFDQSPLFRGGLPHLLAPEMAASISAGVQPVKPGPSSEVYTLAATLWRSATGVWPLDYAAADVDADQLRGPELRAVIAEGKVPLTKPSGWTPLLDILRPVLEAPQTQRPAAADLAVQLTFLALESR